MLEIELHEKPVVAIENIGNHFCLCTQELANGPVAIVYSRSMKKMALAIKATYEKLSQVPCAQTAISPAITPKSTDVAADESDASIKPDPVATENRSCSPLSEACDSPTSMDDSHNHGAIATVDPLLLHAPGGPFSSYVGSVDGERSNADPRDSDPAIKIEDGKDHSAVQKGIQMALDCIKQTRCKTLAKMWIRIVEPKKQGRFPYTKDLKPNWWPESVRHKEPDHLLKKERLELLTTLLLNFPEHHEMFLNQAKLHDPGNSLLYGRLFSICNRLLGNEIVDKETLLKELTAEMAPEEPGNKPLEPASSRHKSPMIPVINDIVLDSMVLDDIELDSISLDDIVDAGLHKDLDTSLYEDGSETSSVQSVDPELIDMERTLYSDTTPQTSPESTAPWLQNQDVVHDSPPRASSSGLLTEMLLETLGEYGMLQQQRKHQHQHQMPFHHGSAGYSNVFDQPMFASHYGMQRNTLFGCPMAMFSNPATNSNHFQALQFGNHSGWPKQGQLSIPGMPMMPVYLPPFMDGPGTNPFYMSGQIIPTANGQSALSNSQATNPISKDAACERDGSQPEATPVKCNDSQAESPPKSQAELQQRPQAEPRPESPASANKRDNSQAELQAKPPGPAKRRRTKKKRR